jgi:hypothetical protein
MPSLPASIARSGSPAPGSMKKDDAGFQASSSKRSLARASLGSSAVRFHPFPRGESRRSVRDERARLGWHFGGNLEKPSVGIVFDIGRSKAARAVGGDTLAVDSVILIGDGGLVLRQPSAFLPIDQPSSSATERASARARALEPRHSEREEIAQRIVYNHMIIKYFSRQPTALPGRGSRAIGRREGNACQVTPQAWRRLRANAAPTQLSPARRTASSSP